MLDKLINHDEWIEFYTNKVDKGHLNKKEEKELKDFIDNKLYIEIANNIYNYTFSYPKKSEISKLGKSKKRVVYQYKSDENYILKFISYQLYKYDHIFSNNLYSYRKTTGVKCAINRLSSIKGINNMYGYKVDISNYFNSINIDILLNILSNTLYDDKELYRLLKQLLVNPYVIYNGKTIVEEKGVMGGVPISAFLANLYLIEMDKYFYDNKIIYFRYADDILIFSKDKNELIKYIEILKKYLVKYKLSVNPDKEEFYNPHDEIEFLGFSFKDGTIDLSSNTIKKIKGKIKRSARGIRRWMIRKDAKEEYALKAMNRKFNNKFYSAKDKNDLDWSRWFFPIINTTKSLKIIDNYLQENLRYIVCGRYNKKNYERVPYTRLKECNYKPLVHEYYEYKKAID